MCALPCVSRRFSLLICLHIRCRIQPPYLHVFSVSLTFCGDIMFFMPHQSHGTWSCMHLLYASFWNCSQSLCRLVMLTPYEAHGAGDWAAGTSQMGNYGVESQTFSKGALSCVSSKKKKTIVLMTVWLVKLIKLVLLPIESFADALSQVHVQWHISSPLCCVMQNVDRKTSWMVDFTMLK